MTHNNQPNPLQDTLLMPGPRYFERAVGWVCVLIAAGLAAFEIFLLRALFSGNGKLWGILALLFFSTALIYFFATVGRRLILNRPNTFDSIASPVVWFTCFGVFGFLTLLFIAFAIAKRDFALAQGATFSALLALLSFGAASHFRHRRKPRVQVE